MSLAEFIHANKMLIITEWEIFARTLSPAKNLTAAQLRDHIEPILMTIARDLDSPQSDHQQPEKSPRKTDSTHEGDTAAEIHGNLRHDEGFDIVQMVSEYRALRSSVIKLWTNSKKLLSATDVEDLIRFNEAIDQALAESVDKFTRKVDYSKDLFLGILAHDVRSPLGAMNMCAQLMSRVGTLNEKQTQLAGQMMDCGTRMSEIVSNLLDLTRANVGAGLSVTRVPMDMRVLAQQMVDEMQIQYKDRSIVLEASGDMSGEWDTTRIGQIFSNLIGNAIQYGAKNLPILISLKGAAHEVTIEFNNKGEPISPKNLDTLFDSFTRAENNQDNTGSGTANLGLGLFITKEIVTAHDGSIKVTSTQKEGTSFYVTLPRNVLLANAA